MWLYYSLFGSMNLSIIDADSVTYQLAWRYQDVSTTQMKSEVDNWVRNILTQTEATHYLGFVGGVGNFRKEVATTKPYKGQRKEDPEGVRYWKPIIKGHLLDHWGFTQVDGQEADDACSVAHSLYSQEYEVTIAHIDWDLDAIPGKHFNYGKSLYYSLTPFQAQYNFWHQMITGCSGDEVPGLPKGGPVKATKVLLGLEDEEYLKEAVQDAYYDKLGSGQEAGDYYTEQYTLLKLLETEQYGFQCPQPIPIPQVQEPILESIDHLFN